MHTFNSLSTHIKVHSLEKSSFIILPLPTSQGTKKHHDKIKIKRNEDNSIKWKILFNYFLKTWIEYCVYTVIIMFTFYVMFR